MTEMDDSKLEQLEIAKDALYDDVYQVDQDIEKLRHLLQELRTWRHSALVEIGKIEQEIEKVKQ